MAYELKTISAPRAAGPMLRAFVAAVEGPLTAQLLGGQLLASAGIPALRKAEATDHYTGRPPAAELFGARGEAPAEGEAPVSEPIAAGTMRAATAAAGPLDEPPQSREGS